MIGRACLLENKTRFPTAGFWELPERLSSFGEYTAKGGSFMQFIRCAALALIAAGIAAPALAVPNAMHNMHNAMASKALNINMGQQNGSKQDGTASVKD